MEDRDAGRRDATKKRGRHGWNCGFTRAVNSVAASGD